MKLDHLRTGEELWDVAGRGVVRIPRLVSLGVAVRVGEGDLAFLDVAPVRALAAVIGEPLEERGEIRNRRVGLEPD